MRTALYAGIRASRMWLSPYGASSTAVPWFPRALRSPHAFRQTHRRHQFYGGEHLALGKGGHLESYFLGQGAFRAAVVRGLHHLGSD